MQTIKLKIKSISDKDFVLEKQKNYSFAFRKLFAYINNGLLSDDLPVIYKELSEEFNLDSWEICSLKSEVDTKIAQTKTAKEKLQVKLDDYIEQFKTETNKRKRYKLHKNICFTKRALNRNIVFGGRINLINYVKAVQNNSEQASKLKQIYDNNRILPINLVGEAPQHGNRKFNFDFENNTIVYKPNRTTKIDISYISNANYKRYLCELTDLIKNKLTAISVKLTTDFIYIIFDEIPLKYRINKRDFIAGDKIHNKKVFDKRNNNRLTGKISNRYASVDLNPQYIGFSICDKTCDSMKIIYKCCFDLSKLSAKLKLSSTDKKQVKQNHKRKHEISQIWKFIFSLIIHFKVAHFIIEDLDFKKALDNKEARRQTKNIWHRTLTTNLINKYCNKLGIDLIKVNACYSSFIGNIQYTFFDPVNASLELNRRGINKFEKNSFYPQLTSRDLNTMSSIAGDVKSSNDLLFWKNWKHSYDFFKTAKLRYRHSLGETIYKENELKSHKSLIKTYSF